MHIYIKRSECDSPDTKNYKYIYLKEEEEEEKKIVASLIALCTNILDF